MSRACLNTCVAIGAKEYLLVRASQAFYFLKLLVLFFCSSVIK